MTEGWAELDEAIAAIRAGIEKAAAEGSGSTVAFEVGPVELELVASVHKDASGKVKVTLLPWSAEVGAGVALDHTQRIKLTLQPVEPDTGRSGEAEGPRQKKIVSGVADERSE